MNDEYLTIADDKIGEGYYTEKRSKFLAFSHHVSTTDEIKAIIGFYKTKYYDSRHVCYAYVLGADRTVFRANDDGEPSGTGGKPILGQINSNTLTDILVVVVRYYGGVNLGTSGLAIAYRTAALSAIKNAVIVKKYVEEDIVFSFPYVMLNAVMRIVKEMSPRIISQTYNNTCEMRFSIRSSEAMKFKEKLRKLSFQ